MGMLVVTHSMHTFAPCTDTLEMAINCHHFEVPRFRTFPFAFGFALLFFLFALARNALAAASQLKDDRHQDGLT